MPRLNCDLFEPSIGTQTTNSLVIFPNQIAAGLEDYHGQRAQTLANTLGMHVLGYERPHTISSRTFNLSLRRQVATNPAEQSADTARQLETFADHNGIDDLYVVGNSAGGAEAIGVTAAGILPIRKLVVTDPPGLRTVAPIKGEVIDYAWYQLWTERKRPAVEGLPGEPNPDLPPEIQPGFKETITRTLAEIVVYSRLWRSTKTLEAMRHIAKDQPDISADFEFPEHTYTASFPLLAAIVHELNRIRSSEHAAAFFCAGIIRGAFHSYFDNNQHFAQVVREKIDRN